MPIPIQNVCGSEPNLNACATEVLVDDFSRCLANNSACRYAIPAGSTSSYCIHHDHARLHRTTVLGPRLDQEARRAPGTGQTSRLHAKMPDTISSVFRYIFRSISHHF
jgi:hypothetical protein